MTAGGGGCLDSRLGVLQSVNRAGVPNTGHRSVAMVRAYTRRARLNTAASGTWQLWELILVEHYIDQTLDEGPTEPRTNRESEIERRAEQRRGVDGPLADGLDELLVGEQPGQLA